MKTTAVFAVIAGTVQATSDNATSLRDLAAKHGIFFGAAANEGELSSSSSDEPVYASTLRTQYSLITAENSCKWGPTEPVQGQYDFSACDYLLDWTQKSDVNQTFRGHNLCWGVYNPDWLTKLGPSDLRNALADHIQKVVPHYNGKAYGWDVVNEAISDGGANVPLFKNTTWYPAVPDYVNFAFTTAGKVATSATKLFYNDYNVASATGWSQHKSDRMFNMVKDMKSKGIPIDGVGLQLHVDTNYDMVDGVAQNLARYETLGMEVHMTEVDVGCASKDKKTCDNWGPDEEKKQAQLYAALLKACLDSSACKNFETWGFTDAHTWRTGLHPLPFDENYAEKPAVQAMRDTMEKALLGLTSEWVTDYYERVNAQTEPAAMPTFLLSK